MRQSHNEGLEWYARIEKDGRPVGTGFLIDSRRLLTCAHVVGDGTGLQVVVTGMEARPVTCGPVGGWEGSNLGVGDVAVLELAEPVSRKPARFATLNTVRMHADEIYEAFGYPFGHPSGVGISIGVRPRPLLFGASCQLDGDNVGVALAPGFSGSAVYRKGTYEVVGMITSAVRDLDLDIGAMLPVESLVKYLPELMDLIPLGPFSAQAHQDLHRMLSGLMLHNPGRFYAQALGADAETAPPGSEFAFVDAMSVLEAICEMDREPETIKRYASHLLVEIALDQSSPELKTGLLHWMQHNALSTDVPVSVMPPAHVITRIISSAKSEQFRHVTIWTVHNEKFESVFNGGVPVSKLQTEVEHLLDVAISRIPRRVDTVVMEFVLPSTWLSLPVDEWVDLDDDNSWLGWSRPVVLRDVGSFDHGFSRELTRRSEQIAESTLDMAGLLRRRDCEHEQSTIDHFKAWLRGPEKPLAVALAGLWAAEEWISTAVAGGVPVILWPRRTCNAHHRSPELCQGMKFTDTLTKRLTGIGVRGLAMAIKDLRAEAGPGSGEFHCGNGISLFLNNTERRPPKALLGYAELG